jgi:hypothetical protein
VRVGLEKHAYEFIHTTKPEEIFKMKFDVIIGNPPYQLDDGEQMEQYAIPLYQEFVKSAIRLKPSFVCMITPSRWFSGGGRKNLDDFRHEMLDDDRIKQIDDFPDASECFPGVEIKGGVNYFLWSRDYHGQCLFNTHKNGVVIYSKKRTLNEYGHDLFIRDTGAITILEKVLGKKMVSLSTIVGPQTPFGLLSSFNDFSDKKTGLTVYGNKRIGFLPEKYSITKNASIIGKWKIFVPKAVGSGSSETDVINPIIAAPNTVCTQTYLFIGPFIDETQCENVVSYIGTKFFHFMVSLIKNTQDGMAKVYQFVPLVDVNQEWNDSKLYKLFGLTQEEINYIETSVWPKKAVK